ncbi:MAG: tRNA (adenosine(37)-N6)-dimethylallyltransferase, partial [Microgenomates group bacterium]
MNKILVICGPTATGKTGLGIKLARTFTGEIVSADSRQVYKGMDIGTGKDLPVNSQFAIRNSQFGKAIGYYEISGVKVWLYDVVEPDYQFSVADYVECASLVIKDIWRREKLPILVGGTGFYIKGVIDGVETLGIPPDWQLRKKLSNYQISKLQIMLKKIDLERWERMNESDRNNPRRLIRAIEIALKSQKSKVKSQKFNIKDKLLIGLRVDYKNLYQRIDKRVEERVKQGIVEEIKNLLKKGYNWENSALGTTIGYKEWKPYFINSQSAIRNSQ